MTARNSADRALPLAVPPRSPGKADVRYGERWTRAQRLKNLCLYLVIKGALACADALPSRALLFLTRCLGTLAYRLLADARSLAETNLAAALPDCDAKAIARRAFVNAGENLGRSLLLRRAGFAVAAQVSIAEESRALLARVAAEGRGAVFVSAHLGPFEWLAARVAQLPLRAAVVVRESYDPRLDALVDRHRLAHGISVIHRGHPDAAIAIARALRSGLLVGFLSDLGSRVLSAPVALLGARTLLPVGPQKFALRFGVPLLVGALKARSQGCFELQIEQVYGNNLEDLTHRVARALETAIRSDPEHWLWMARPLGDGGALEDSAADRYAPIPPELSKRQNSQHSELRLG